MNNSSSPILNSKLSLDSDVPLYNQLVAIIKRNISAGILVPGDILPSEAELCKSLAISRSTVRQAIGALESEGLVVRRQGKGTFVAEPKVHRKTERVYSFTAEMTAMGITPSSDLIEFKVIQPTPDIVKMLELRSNDIPVYKFSRIRKADGEPLMLETSFYPQYIYPNLTPELLTTHSFYSLLYDVGIIPYTAVDTYEAVKFSKADAELLHCRVGSAGFFMQRQTRTESGECYEFTQTYMRGDRASLEIIMHKDGVSFSRSVDKTR